ncbi:MAG: methionine biosynthesis protein MetW [Candidatus Anstonellales archaeon]
MDRISFRKAAPKDAENVRRELLRKGILNADYFVERDSEWVYFPLVKGAEGDVERDGRKKKKRLPVKELVGAPVRYEIIGDLCVVELPKGVSAKKVAEGILRFHKNVKGVFKKASAVEGEYRVRKLEHIAGEKRTTTWHKENGCWIYVDIAKVHFSPRMAEERKRVVEKIRKGSNVMVMFAGAGPYVIEIAKHRKAKAVGIELNKDAVECMRKGIERAKCNAVAVEGDVREKAHEWKGWASYVIMPLPANSEEFIEEAVEMLKRKGKLVIYSFWEKGTENNRVKMLEGRIAKLGAKAECRWRPVKSYSPSKNKVCVECTVEKHVYKQSA